MTQEILLQVENIEFGYNHVPAVVDLSFEIKRGEVVALLGTNGAGKSTALNIITGNLKPAQGSVAICGKNIFTKPKLAKNNLGYLPDTPPLYRELNVKEYLTYVAQLHNIDNSSIRSSVASAMEVCGLSAVTRTLIANLSKGFQQRVGIAQAIIHKPALIVLDEPTIGLDPIQMQEIRTLLQDLSTEHSVLLSTHLLAEVNSSCNRALIIEQGRLLLDQALDELHQHSEEKFKLRFHGRPSIDELMVLPGCESVSCTQYGHYVCRVKDRNFIQQVQSQALEKNWQLYEIAPMANSLEQVFVDLVMRESSPPNAMGEP